MGILKIFSGRIDIGKTANNLLGKLDDSSLTSQEKADLTKDFYIKTMDENSIRSRTRRSIAIMLIINYILVFWVVIAAFGIDQLTEIEIDMKQLIGIITSFQIPISFIAVITFFFGGYYIPKFSRKKK
jgi:hypothetical protein